MVFLWNAWRTGDRFLPWKIFHAVFGLIRLMEVIVVLGCFIWFWFTSYNAINATASFFMIDFIPATIAFSTALPLDFVLTIPLIAFGFFGALGSFCYSVVFLVLFGDAAWATDNVYMNDTTRLIEENARTLMLVIWWLGIPRVILQFMQMGLFLIYFICYFFAATPAARITGFFGKLFQMPQIDAIPGFKKVFGGML